MTTFDVELKAGKIDWDGTTCTPDATKGMIRVTETSFEFWERKTKKELIVKDTYPVNKDAYLEKVDKVTDGRVWVLKYKNSQTRKFFWLQEPEVEADEENLIRINSLFGTEDIPPKKVRKIEPVTGTGNDAMAANLANILGGLMNQPQQGQITPVPLKEILTSEVLMRLLEDKEAVSELLGHLPEDQRSEEDLAETFHSPQLKQNMNVLTQAIYSDQLPILFSMLGLDPATEAGAARPEPMEALCKALEKKHKK